MALTQLRNGAALLQQTQPIFADLLLDLPPRHWQTELSWLEGELAWLDEALALERLTDERGHYFRTLQCHDLLLEALQQRQRQLPSLESVRQIWQLTLCRPDVGAQPLAVCGAASGECW